MDQIKIGKYIAACRKQQNLTQMQLADKLDITDKAVSKWERGITMPDSSIMLALCDILGINVNELLSGEKIAMENNNQKKRTASAGHGPGNGRKKQDHLDFHVDHHGIQHDRPSGGHLHRGFPDSPGHLAAGHHPGNLYFLFDPVLLRRQAGGQRRRLQVRQLRI